MAFYLFLISMLFAIFVFLDLASHLPRVCGSALRLNGLGFAFQTMVNTIKRIFLVLIPPSLGLVVFYGEPLDVFIAVFSCHAAASLSFVVAYMSRRVLASALSEAIRFYSEGNSLVGSFVVGVKGPKMGQDVVSLKFTIGSIRRDIFIPAVWIFFFYSGSGFLVNLIAMISGEFSVVILQLTGALNAFGTMVLAFFLDPRISRIYEVGEDPQSVYVTLFSAQVVNVLVISPIFYSIIAVYFYAST